MSLMLHCLHSPTLMGQLSFSCHAWRVHHVEQSPMAVSSILNHIHIKGPCGYDVLVCNSSLELSSLQNPNQQHPDLVRGLISLWRFLVGGTCHH